MSWLESDGCTWMTLFCTCSSLMSFNVCSVSDCSYSSFWQNQNANETNHRGVHWVDPVAKLEVGHSAYGNQASGNQAVYCKLENSVGKMSNSGGVVELDWFSSSCWAWCVWFASGRFLFAWRLVLVHSFADFQRYSGCIFLSLPIAREWGGGLGGTRWS